VLATNVAETSLTVPGIRYVIDTGVARVNRYSWRNKVEQLQIEKISRASANQRAGRCGRVAPGICIRLYSEEDYSLRRDFGEPEILRSSLAAVILRMKSLHIGDVEDFPFLDPPTPRMIADGYQLLQELGAVDETRGLTRIGWQLAKFPIDPRIARMVLAAQRETCLHEVLIIASALSIQDPRERPFDRAEAADQAQEQFQEERSDFLAYLKLWSFFEEAIKHKKSNRKLMELLHEHFLSHRRMREWRDIHGQLAALVGELGMKPNDTPASYEQIHRALLAGLLGNIGTKSDDGPEYIGARGIRFLIFPGSVLRKAQPKWVMAAELVETTRLYARNAARIVPEWIEPLAVHLVTRHYSDPHWDKERGMVMAYERVALHGLTIVPRRRVHYGPLNPLEAREIFIHRALAAGEFETRGEFFRHNRRLVAELKVLEAKARRRDVLVDEHTVYEFYDGLVPEGIYNAVGFERWRREAEIENPKLLFLTREYLVQHAAADISEALFPDTLRAAGTDFKLTYRFEPGHALDGVTVTVPLQLLNRLEEADFDWLVPGLVREKATWAIKALPKNIRRLLFPLPDQVSAFLDAAEPSLIPDPSPEGRREKGVNPSSSGRITNPSPSGRGVGGREGFFSSLRKFVQRRIGEPIAEDTWRDKALPAHLQMNFRVVDEAGRELAGGRDLLALKGQLGQAAQLTFAKAEPGIERSGLRAWDFGDLPEEIAFTRGGRRLTGYPALVDEGNSVAIRLFDLKPAAEEAMRGGVRRLLRLAMREQMRQLEKSPPAFLQAALLLRNAVNAEDLREDLLNAIADRAFIGDDALPRTQAAFEVQRGRARTRLPAVTEASTRLLAAIAAEYQQVSLRLSSIKGPLAKPAADIRAQLARLIHKGFVSATPWDQLAQLPRYLKAMQLRLDKYGSSAERDAKHTDSIAQLTKRLDERIDKYRKAGTMDPRLEEFRWHLEELRVSLFAQELKTPYPVSAT
jgi:ATP-dependent helicase HrpA